MMTVPRFANSGYAAVKHQVDQFNTWPTWQKLRRGMRAPFYRLPDTGLFGLTPLKMHILICGFPAAGTTLLQLMMENGLPDARRFGKERSGWRAATYSTRNHEIMISKQPQDLLRLKPLKDFYADRKATLKTIVMLRDPRDLMTTQRERGDAKPYCYPSEYWKNYYDAFISQFDCQDTLLVRYEDLVADPLTLQQAIENFVDQKMDTAFDKFETVERNDFDTTTLRGLRPVDSNHVARWQAPQHEARVRQILAELPDLPAMVQRLGYAQDDAWTHPYL